MHGLLPFWGYLISFMQLCRYVNGDAINTNLTAGESVDNDTIYCIPKCNGYNVTVNRNGCICKSTDRGHKSVCIRWCVAYELDLIHILTVNNKRGVLIETSGVTIVSNVRGAGALVVGNGYAILCPYLLFGSVNGTVCRIGEGELLSSKRHALLSAAYTYAVNEGVRHSLGSVLPSYAA